MKGDNDKAISDYNKSIKISPYYPETYASRALVYFYKAEYDKAWKDVHQAQKLGLDTQPEFLAELRQVSGREK